VGWFEFKENFGLKGQTRGKQGNWFEFEEDQLIMVN
jgi:hypothetical protein